jgi:hypothetical protein
LPSERFAEALPKATEANPKPVSDLLELGDAAGERG